ncbi:hypothetical protein LOC67_16755 [Stieleria sp. JC731]|uniref:c-type cytochrome domain-containing protein n=1 Tax=Pirellulaceae TaxID=2691357 RepID=UPI001E350F06|nr:c-type cytochrome domain-containing protein [Stieleria sp. JC731]MCC9602208.1 hypothetical protein [Stieleria sp. JC731]
MRRNHWVFSHPFVFTLSIAFIAFAQARNASADDQIDYAKEVHPIFEAYCIGCHSKDDSEGGLALDSFEKLVDGGETGTAITPGVPTSSRLFLMMTGKLTPTMPPDDAEGPNEAELAIIEKWIEQGATGPSGDMPIKKELRTPKIEPTGNTPLPITAIASASEHQQYAVARYQNITVHQGSETTAKITDAELGKVNALSFSRDGTRLLVASGLTGAYGRAAIYDTTNGQLLREFVGHKDTLYAAKFSPDESSIATAGYDQKISIWDTKTGKVIRILEGHNGAIFDLAYSPDGKVLVSACADETVKVWNVEQGVRLDTLGQPEGEVYAVSITQDGRHIVAGSADNRIRVWQLRSVDKPQINPIIATRFVDETPIVNLAITPDNLSLVVLAESGNVKVLTTSDWQPTETLEQLDSMGTGLFCSADSRTVTIGMMNGKLATRELRPTDNEVVKKAVDQGDEAIYLDLPESRQHQEAELRQTQKERLAREVSGIVDVGRGVQILGTISEPDEKDVYRWPCHRGEIWAIDADAIENSRLDPIVTILDAANRPVQRIRLQAERDSYFTFRGKDSEQSGDFRVFNWQEMKLGQFFYAAGEVSRLMIHPRGPDSGFIVYPGKGQRWTYFGTSGRTHALGEPAYVVRPLGPDEEPLANGLPVFEIAYENDDDPMRQAGKNSRLLFKAPADGLYSVRLSDTRHEGGEDYQYRLSLRAAAPSFKAKTQQIQKPLKPATGREFTVDVERLDGFDGPINIEIEGLPERLYSNLPLTIEAGLQSATGLIWATPGETGWESTIEPTLTAWAMINGKRVERRIGSVGQLKFDSTVAQVVPSIVPADQSGSEIGPHESWTLDVSPGQTVSALVRIDRKDGFDKEVSFGKEFSGRNAAQGVYVDNIGLNGLLILADSSEREFFITADETALPGQRTFFLTAEVEGGLSTFPITINVR